MACITGDIAQAFYGGVPEHIERHVMARLDVRLEGVLKEFVGRFA